MKTVIFATIVLIVVSILSSCSVRMHHSGSTTSREQVTSLLEKQKYRAVLEATTRGNRPGVPRPGMEREYLIALNQMIDQGATDMAEDKFAIAGTIFRSVLNDFPQSDDLQSRVKWNDAKLSKAIKSCADQLMEEGLNEYRQGNLQGAIKIWKKLLAFDPNYPGARKALDTANIQLNSLRGISN